MKKFTLLCLLVTIHVFSQAQTTITLQPDGLAGNDAVLHGLASEVNVNYGNIDQFPGGAWTFGGNPGVLRSIVEFDLSSIPPNAIVNSAELSLYAYTNTTGFGQHSTLSGTNDCWIERITSTWNESTVTWNNQPTTTIQNRVSLPSSTSPTQDYLNINVNALVNDMLSNPGSSFGFMLKLKTESYYRLMNFCSSDHLNSMLRPKLVITYSISDTCITLQPDGLTGKDAIMHGLASEVNINYGNNDQFTAGAWTFGGNPGVLRSIVEFDFSSLPPNAIVNSAQLSLYAITSTTGFGQHSTLSGTNDCWIERVTSTWNESTATWSNQPTTTTLNRVSLPASTSPTQDYLNINVFTLVQDMLNNPGSSFGFMLKLKTESFYRLMNFCSSDHANPALRPKLDICYTLNTGLNENSQNNSISMYPNPAQDMVTIKTNAILVEPNYIITDVTGRIFSVGKLSSEINQINISELSSGLYFIKIGVQNQRVYKLIKE